MKDSANFLVCQFISLTVIATSAKATLSREYSRASTSNVDTAVCYMQTEEGRILDLSHLCGNPVKNTAANSVLIRRLLETKQCPRCNLSDANLSGANLVGADLSSANLSNVDLRNANMLGANLNSANLSNAKLDRTVMPDGTIHN